MSYSSKNERGFGSIELLLIIVIITTVGVIGWIAHKDHHVTTKNTTQRISNPPIFKTISSTSSGTDQSNGKSYIIKGQDITIYGESTSGSADLKVTKVVSTSSSYEIYSTETVPGVHCGVEDTFVFPQTTIQLTQPINKVIHVHSSVVSQSC